MLHNVWTVLCRDIITDQETNAVSYVRCIEEGSASSLPVSIGPVFFREIRDNARLHYRVVGFIDDNPIKVGKKIHGIPVRGSVGPAF